jgi:hypothetical protein
MRHCIESLEEFASRERVVGDWAFTLWLVHQGRSPDGRPVTIARQKKQVVNRE